MTDVSRFVGFALLSCFLVFDVAPMAAGCGGEEDGSTGGRAGVGSGGSPSSGIGGAAGVSADSGDEHSTGTGGSSTGGGAGQSIDSGYDGDAGIVSGPIGVTRLRTEYRVNPLGIDVKQPRLEWWLASDQRAQKQTAYQVLVASSEAKLAAGQGDLWDSGKVASDRSIQVVYQGSPLGSRTRAFWKVRVWDRDDIASPYSATAFWEMGLLLPTDWTASWIAGSAPLSTAGLQWLWYPEGDPVTSAPAGTRDSGRPST